MTNDCVLRFVSATDVVFPEVRALRQRVLYEPYGVDLSPVDFDDANPAASHLVVFCRGYLAGYGRVEVRGEEAQIRHLAVDQAYRGRGIGTEMLDALLGRARSMGAQRVFLNARFTALGLYRSRGFLEVGPIFHTESTHLPHKRMELALAREARAV